MYDSAVNAYLKSLRVSGIVYKLMNSFNPNVPLTKDQKLNLITLMIDTVIEIFDRFPNSRIKIYSDYTMFVDNPDLPREQFWLQLK